MAGKQDDVQKEGGTEKEGGRGKGGSGLQSLQSLGASLPARARRGNSTRGARRAPAAAEAPVLPECFAEVARRARSKLPAHARERATLEAVASTIPAAARGATGAAAAGVYLAALVLALTDVVAAAQPPAAAADAKDTAKAARKLSRKQRRAQRVRDEQRVQDMSGIAARAPVAGAPAADAEMAPADADAANASRDGGADADFIASLVYLIGLAARGASRALVITKKEAILAPICAALALPDPAPLLARHAAAALAAVLLALDGGAWAAPEAARAYMCLLSIAASPAPKSRRRGREALVAVLRAAPLAAITAAVAGPAAAWFARQCAALAADCEAAGAGAARDEGTKTFTRLLHHVGSVNYFAFVLGDTQLAAVAKELCLLIQRNVRGIIPFAYNALAFLFCVPRAAVDPALIPQQPAELAVEHLGPGLAASQRFLPAEPRVPLKDAAKLLAAAAALELPAVSGSDARVARARALATMAVAVHRFHVHAPPPRAATAAVVDALVRDLDPIALPVAEARARAVFLQELLQLRWVRASSDVFDALQHFATVKFQRLWGVVLPLLKTYLSSGAAVAHPRVHAAVGVFVAGLVARRADSIAAADAAAVALADGLLAAAVRGGAAPHLLQAAPLQRDEKMLLTNAWALPILADNVRHTPIALWLSVLAPVQRDLDAAAQAAAKGDHTRVEGKNMAMYSRQLLALLPGLCTSPTDLAQAQVMSVAFQAIHHCFHVDEIVVQNYGASALRALAESILAANADGGDFRSGVRASFASRLKKLFGSIVALAEKLAREQRGPLLQALTVAARAAGDAGLVVSMLRKAIRRFLEVAVKAVSTADKTDKDAMEDVDAARAGAVRVRHAASDISIAIVESGVIPQDAQEFSLLKRALLPFLQDRTDSALQKKAYRAIVALVTAGAFSASADSTKEVIEELAKSSAEVAPGAHSSRLATVEAIMSICHTAFSEEEQVELIKLCTSTFLAEAVLALRDTSEKTRQAAANSIIAIGKTWRANASPQLGIDNYFIALAAGLGGRSTAMVSGSLIAIGYFMKTFKLEIRTRPTLGTLCDSFFAQSCAADDGDTMTDENLAGEKELTHVRPGPITILLRHEALEVQRAALGVIKVAITVLGSPISRLLEIMPGFLPSLVATAAESKKREIRLRVKVVIERLLRKCGREVMEARFPEEHKRLLSSVRKQHEKEKSKKLERRALSAMKAHERDGAADEAGGGANGAVGNEKEEGFDFDIDSDDSDVEHELLDGNEMLAQKQRQKANRAMAAQMEEPRGEVFDLLASDSINIAHANKLSSYAKAEDEGKAGAKGKARSSAKKGEEEEDAPLVFMESASESEEAEHGSEAEEEEMMPKLKSRGIENAVVGRKRRRKDGDEGAVKRSRGTFGEEYRSKRAAGDVKRAGRPDPYAYIPLGSSVKGANTGTAKGGKLLSSGAGKGAKAKRKLKTKLPGRR